MSLKIVAVSDPILLGRSGRNMPSQRALWLDACLCCIKLRWHVVLQVSWLARVLEFFAPP